MYIPMWLILSGLGFYILYDYSNFRYERASRRETRRLEEQRDKLKQKQRDELNLKDWKHPPKNIHGFTPQHRQEYLDWIERGE
jgi:hypothetical protein